MPVIRLPEIMHRDDVRMAEPRKRRGLAAEALREILTHAEFKRQKLDRHGPIQRFLPRAIHRAHPAAPEQRLEFIRGKKRRDFLHRRRHPRARHAIAGQRRLECAAHPRRARIGFRHGRRGDSRASGILRQRGNPPANLHRDCGSSETPRSSSLPLRHSPVAGGRETAEDHRWTTNAPGTSKRTCSA